VCSEHTFDICAYGSRLRFKATDAESFSILNRYVLPTFPRIESATSEADLEIRIDRVAKAFQLSARGEVLSSAEAPIELVRDLIREIDETAVRRLTSLRAVHAGVVLWRGRAMLFPGATHAGKSSLVAELLRRGATYFSDEYALVDSEGLVHPYPRPLLMRNGRLEQLPVLAADFSAPVGKDPAPVGWILSLEYHPQAHWNLTAVSQGPALLLLLQNTPHTLEESPEMVCAFRNLVSKADCFAGTRNDAAEAAGEIFRLVDSNS
jgi:hypothetical protein